MNVGKLKWQLKMTLGFFCYHLFITFRLPMHDNPTTLWLWSWCGFYGYDTGYGDYKERLAALEVNHD